MNNHLLSTDTLTLKQLFQEPIYLLKNEFNTEEKPLFHLDGENSKNIVFIVFSEDKSLSSLDQDLFSKTLTGLKLANNEVAFGITSVSQATNFESISKELPNQRVVCFGNSNVYSSELLLQILAIGTSRILPCPALHELSSDQSLKIKWWNSLKAFVS